MDKQTSMNNAVCSARALVNILPPFLLSICIHLSSSVLPCCLRSNPRSLSRSSYLFPPPACTGHTVAKGFENALLIHITCSEPPSPTFRIRNISFLKEVQCSTVLEKNVGKLKFMTAFCSAWPSHTPWHKQQRLFKEGIFEANVYVAAAPPPAALLKTTLLSPLFCVATFVPPVNGGGRNLECQLCRCR